MTSEASLLDRLVPLVIAQLDGEIAACDAEELDRLVCQNEEARQLYLSLIRESASLRYWSGHTADDVPTDSNPFDVKTVSPPLSLETGPVIILRDTGIPGKVGYFSSDWPIAYLSSAVICTIGILILASIPVHHYYQVANVESGTGSLSQEDSEEDASDKADEPLGTSLPPLIGQITGMVDCKWSDPQTEAFDAAYVPLGRKYAISSGLLEITYDTGARVILQGPCTYEVESETGGYLSLGKLTARVEKRSEVRGQRSEVIASSPRPSDGRGAGGEGGGDVNSSLPPTHYPLSTASPLSTLHSPLFTIKTPTAVVTDLGTEFGVEVNKTGATLSHVLRGSIRVQVVVADGKAGGAGQVLHENESARVESTAKGSPQLTVIPSTAALPSFVRTMPTPTIKTFDLVDVVAGGDGYSGRRSAGIDSRSGRTSDTIHAPKGDSDYLTGDQKYHRVEALPLVDGVFIPDGRSGAVQTDSAGHAFDWFGATSNLAAGFVWAMGPEPAPTPRTELGGVEYGSAQHALLYLPTNNGVTFDLSAIRQANPGCRLLRFRAVVGNTETASETGYAVSADVWVLVDGQSRFRRQEINAYSGEFPVVVPLGEKDCFLTLAATDGGNGVSYDWVLFGDPRLEVLSNGTVPDPSGAKQEQQLESGKEAQRQN